MSRRKAKVIPVELDGKKSRRQMVDEVVDAILTCQFDGRTRGNGTTCIYLTPEGLWLCDEHYEEYCDFKGIPSDQRH